MIPIARCTARGRGAAGGKPAGLLACLALLAGLPFLAGCGDFVLFPEDQVLPVADFSIDPTTSQSCEYETVEVDGSGSSDPEDDDLTYLWEFAEKPSGSNASFADSDAETTDFSPDEPGTYQVKLTVTAATREVSSSKTASMTANTLPIAEFTYTPASLKAGDEVTLDGNASMNPLDDCASQGLTFLWELTSKPEGSQAVLDDPASATPKFTADEAGDYQVELTVTQESTSATHAAMKTLSAAESSL